MRKAVKMPLVLLGGITSLEHLQTASDEGFELAAMGRAFIHDPGLIARYAAGAARDSGCVPCNRCVAEMDRRAASAARSWPSSSPRVPLACENSRRTSRVEASA